MRCFLAIDLPEEIKEELLKIEREIQLFLTGNFVESKNMHLTLKFLGEIDEDKLKEIIKKLKKINLKKFKARLGKFGFFPNKNYVNVVWVSLEPSDKIIKLNDEIKKALENSEKEKFHSHITLARVKRIIDKKEFFERRQYLKIKQIEFEIRNFILKKSTLTSNGPVYEDLEKFKLI